VTLLAKVGGEREAKKPSTALSQDADVGVKWKAQRGCRANHWRTFGCLIVVDDSVDLLSRRHLRFDGVEIAHQATIAADPGKSVRRSSAWAERRSDGDRNA
jgi:hypothetical protein